MSEILDTKSITANGEVQLIQNEIETYTKKIEHEKINLRLAKERYQKQLDNLLKLQGKPAMTKEKKIKSFEQKARKSLMEIPKLDKTKLLKQQDFIEQEIIKNDLILEKIINETNQVALDNNEIRKKIEELRKEKINQMQMVNMLSTHGKIINSELEELQIQNMINEGKQDKKKERKLRMLASQGSFTARDPEDPLNPKEKGAICK